MKPVLSIFLTALLGLLCPASAAPSTRIPANVDRVALKNTARTAIEEAVAKFVESQSVEQIKTYALFPVSRDIDDNYYTQVFSEAFTEAANKSGMELITSASSKDFNRLLEEFAATQDVEGVIDEATKQKIDKVIDYQAILLPRIDLESSPDDTHALKASINVIYREVGKKRSFGSEFFKVPGALSPSDMMRSGLWIAGGLLALILLVLFLRAIRRAARPR
jgi:hypothetical protein